MPLNVRCCFALAAAVPGVLLLAGCRAYTARPLDLRAHQEAWAARGPEAEGVAEFARRLSEAERVPAAFDPSDGLSLPEAEVVALFFNADLRAERLRAEVARAGAETAGLWEDPEFGFSGERILSSVAEPWVAGATLGITLPISGRLDAEKGQAEAAHRAALQRIAAAEWDTRVRLRRAWLEWSAAALRAEQTRAFLAELEGVASVAERLEEAGEMSRPEASLFRVERATRRIELRLIEEEVRQGELAIRALMGMRPEAPLVLLRRNPAPMAVPGDERDAAAERSPTLAVLRAEYETAEESLRHEVRRQYPDITIGPGFGTEDGDPRVLLGVSLPIPLWNRNQRGVAEAEAQREVARAEFESAYERLISDLAMAESRLATLSAQREELETVLAPMVDGQVADVRRIAEAGEINALLTLEVLVRQHQTRLRLIDVRLEEALGGVRVEELVGPAPSAAAPSAGDTP